MPLVLFNGGCRAITNTEDAICYAFNLETCTNKVNAGGWDGRYHVCALPKCGKHHAYVNCPTKSSGSWLHDQECKESHEGELQAAESPTSASHEGDVQTSIPEGAIGEEPERCLKEPFLFIEACCGSALLSPCVARSCFDVLAIDFHGNKHRPFCAY